MKTISFSLFEIKTRLITLLLWVIWLCSCTSGIAAAQSIVLNDDLCERFKNLYVTQSYYQWIKDTKPTEAQKTSWINNAVKTRDAEIKNLKSRNADPYEIEREEAFKCAFQKLHENRTRDLKLQKETARYFAVETKRTIEKNSSDLAIAENREKFLKLSKEEKNKALLAMNRHQKNEPRPGDTKYARYFPYLLPIAGVKYEELKNKINESLRAQPFSKSTVYVESEVKKSYEEYKKYSANIIENPELAIRALENVNPEHIPYFGLIDPSFQPKKSMKDAYVLAHEKVKNHTPAPENPALVKEPENKESPSAETDKSSAKNVAESGGKDSKKKEPPTNKDEKNEALTSSNDGPLDPQEESTKDKPCADCNTIRSPSASFSSTESLDWISKSIRKDRWLRSRSDHHRAHRSMMRRNSFETTASNQAQHCLMFPSPTGFQGFGRVNPYIFSIASPSPFTGWPLFRPIPFAFPYYPTFWNQGQIYPIYPAHPYFPAF
ncbi:MAG: hypothetical protein KGP28_09545 [Bdellovibrionales bacterium]|nr:hypothetical protein [Bdellovibrionales bacterium]